VPGLRDETRSLRDKIAEKRASETLLRNEIKRLDLALGKHRLYMDEDRVISGVSTANFTEADGKQLADPSVKITRQLVRQSNARLDERAKSVSSDGWQKLPEMDAVIAKRQEALADLNKKITDIDALWRDDSDKLNQQKEKIKVTLDKAKSTQLYDTSIRKTNIGKLEVKIRQLLELELHSLADLDPVGRILECNANNPRVIINLGAKDRVIPGLLFEVFQYDRGKYVEKGMVEVVEVRTEIALCRVLRVKNHKTWPIAENDYIGNPVFSADRPKVFFVAGRFNKFNRENIESFIRQTGGIVRDRLTPGTDFLVAGKECERDEDRAREFQVLKMNEEQILKYVRSEFRPTATPAVPAAPAAMPAGNK
jgi:NAD-dependent DNA ligase